MFVDVVVEPKLMSKETTSAKTFETFCAAKAFKPPTSSKKSPQNAQATVMPRDPLIGLVGKPSSGKSTTLNRYQSLRRRMGPAKSCTIEIRNV